jgi:uncharacterized protein HemY
MAWMALAQLKLKQNDFKGARPLLLRSVVSNRDNYTAWQKLAVVYENLQLPEKAAACKSQSSADQ